MFVKGSESKVSFPDQCETTRAIIQHQPPPHKPPRGTSYTRKQAWRCHDEDIHSRNELAGRERKACVVWRHCNNESHLWSVNVVCWVVLVRRGEMRRGSEQ